MEWILALLGFVFLMAVHEWAHMYSALKLGFRVTHYGIFFPPKIFEKEIKGVKYSLGSIPAGAFVKIVGMTEKDEVSDEDRDRAFYAQKPWKRSVVIAAGPISNLVLAFILIMIYAWGIGLHTPTTNISAIEKSYPAAKALDPGDKILKVDGKGGQLEEFSKRIDSHRCEVIKPKCKGTPTTLLVERKGKRFEFTTRPIYDPKYKKMRVGFTFDSYGPHKRMGFKEGLDWGTGTYKYLTIETLKLPARVFDAEKRKEISGVIGSYEVTRKTISYDLGDGVLILALISLALGIINLYPFLPLDGGWLLLSGLEKIRKKPMSIKAMERYSIVGFILIIALFVLGFTNDVGRLMGEGFKVR